MRARLIAVALGAVALTVGVGTAHRLPHAKRCPVFPASNPWNQRVDKLPVASNSGAVIRSIGTDDRVHADFGSGLYDGGLAGIPYMVWTRNHRRVRVSLQ